MSALTLALTVLVSYLAIGVLAVLFSWRRSVAVRKQDAVTDKTGS